MTASSSESPGVWRSCSAFSSRSRSKCGVASSRRSAGLPRLRIVASAAGPPALPSARALVDGGQEGVAVVPRPAVARRRADRDEAGQVLVLGAQAVEHPRAHRRPDVGRRPAVQEQRRRAVRDALGVHRVDEAEVVDVPVDLGEEVGAHRPLSPCWENFQSDFIDPLRRALCPCWPGLRASSNAIILPSSFSSRGL